MLLFFKVKICNLIGGSLPLLRFRIWFSLTVQRLLRLFEFHLMTLTSFVKFFFIASRMCSNPSSWRLLLLRLIWYTLKFGSKNRYLNSNPEFLFRFILWKFNFLICFWCILTHVIRQLIISLLIPGATLGWTFIWDGWCCENSNISFGTIILNVNIRFTSPLSISGFYSQMPLSLQQISVYLDARNTYWFYQKCRTLSLFDTYASGEQI